MCVVSLYLSNPAHIFASKQLVETANHEKKNQQLNCVNMLRDHEILLKFPDWHQVHFSLHLFVDLAHDLLVLLHGISHEVGL